MNIRSQIFKLIQKYPWLSRVVHGHDGFIPETEEQFNENYKFEPTIGVGDKGYVKEILQPGGQWLSFLPPNEHQRIKDGDTMSCVLFSLLNLIEILERRKYKRKKDYSDAYNAKLAGVTKTGTTMTKGGDSVRNYGVVEQVYHPWDNNMTLAEFFRNISSITLQRGEEWLDDYQFNYETVINPTVGKMIRALEFSPLWVAGYAWYWKNGQYHNYGNANHAFLIVGYKEGECWYALDHYSPYIKELAWDYIPQYVKTGYLTGLKPNLLESLKSRGFKYVMRVENLGQIYEIVGDQLIEMKAQDKLTRAVKVLAAQKDLIGVSEDNFKKLI